MCKGHVVHWFRNALAMCGLCLFGVFWFVGWVLNVQSCQDFGVKLPCCKHSSFAGRSVGRSSGIGKKCFGFCRSDYSSRPALWLVLVLCLFLEA